MALSQVYATKTVAMAPSLTILVMVPHVPSNGAPPLCFYFLFSGFFSFWGGFLGEVSIVVGDGQDLHVVLPRVFSYGGSRGSNALA